MQHSGLVRSAWQQKTRKEQQQQHASCWELGWEDSVFHAGTYLVVEGRRQLRGESAAASGGGGSRLDTAQASPSFVGVGEGEWVGL